MIFVCIWYISISIGQPANVWTPTPPYPVDIAPVQAISLGIFVTIYNYIYHKWLDNLHIHCRNTCTGWYTLFIYFLLKLYVYRVWEFSKQCLYIPNWWNRGWGYTGVGRRLGGWNVSQTPSTVFKSSKWNLLHMIPMCMIWVDMWDPAKRFNSYVPFFKCFTRYIYIYISLLPVR